MKRIFAFILIFCILITLSACKEITKNPEKQFYFEPYTESITELVSSEINADEITSIEETTEKVTYVVPDTTKKPVEQTTKISEVIINNENQEENTVVVGDNFSLDLTPSSQKTYFFERKEDNCYEYNNLKIKMGDNWLYNNNSDNKTLLFDNKKENSSIMIFLTLSFSKEPAKKVLDTVTGDLKGSYKSTIIDNKDCIFFNAKNENKKYYATNLDSVLVLGLYFEDCTDDEIQDVLNNITFLEE